MPELAALREAARTIRVGDEVARYLVALVRPSRSHPDLRLGASPRASVALYRASQAWALLAGRGFVLPDDVAAAAVAMTVTASGAVSNSTVKLLTPEQIDAAAKRSPTYRAPGQ